MDYMIMHSENPNEVESMVLKYICKGWELWGGVSVAMFQCSCVYAQAIIKKEG